MLRRSTAFVLIITLLTVNFGRLFIYAGFEANKQLIASKLCENKDKPKMHCNGKCYLAKKIKQAEEKEKSQERQSQKNQFQEALIVKKINLKPAINYVVLSVSIEGKFQLPTQYSDIFQPPRVA